MVKRSNDCTQQFFYIRFFSLDNFIKDQLHQYNLGKRHLANMMGKDPEFFTQKDVDVMRL